LAGYQVDEYNTVRRHSAIGYITSMDLREGRAAAQTQRGQNRQLAGSQALTRGY